MPCAQPLRGRRHRCCGNTLKGKGNPMKRIWLMTTVACLCSMTHVAAAEGDAVAGEKIFQRCASCHVVVDNTHKRGPTLRGIVGRPAASAENFAYSEGLKAFGAGGAVWDETTLDKFLQDPNGFVKGMRMAITPVRRDSDRVNLIAFLKTKS